MPDEQPIPPPPEITVYWAPLANLVARRATWSTITVDIVPSIAPKHPAIGNEPRLLLGSTKLDAMLLNVNDALRSGWSKRRRTAGRLGFLGGADATHLKESVHDGEEKLRLWGLPLSILLGLVGHMKQPFPQPSTLPSPDGFIGAEVVRAHVTT